MLKQIGLLLFFLYLFQPVIGQRNNIGLPVVRNHTKKAYQAGTQNWEIAQDEKGILYFANNEGVLEFDGVTWTVHPISNRTIVRSIEIVNDRIYAGGQGEIGYFYSDEFANWQYQSLNHLIPKEHQKFADIWNIEYYQEQLIFNTFNKVFVLKEERITVQTFEKTIRRRLGNCNGQLYLYALRDGIYTFNNGRFVKTTDWATNYNVTAFLPYTTDTLLVTTLRNGLWFLTNNELSRFETPNNDFFQKNRISDGFPLKNGQFALSTYQKGMIIIDKKGNVHQHLHSENGLQNNEVLSVFKDREKNIWLGLNNGIDFVNISSPFSLIQNKKQIGAGHSLQINNGNIYLGTSQGVYKTDWKNYYDPLKTQDFQMIPETQGQVWGLYTIDNELFMGHHEGTFKIENQRAFPIQSKIGTWIFQPYNKNPNFILVGKYDGLFLYKKENGQLTYVKELEGLEGESCRIMEQDIDGNIWISHPYRGVYKVALDDALNPINKPKLYNSKDGFPSDLFIHVFRIQDEVLFAAEKGIYKYNSKKDQFEVNKTWIELLGSEARVQKLVADKEGNIWYVADDKVGLLKITDQGISKAIRNFPFPQLEKQLIGGFEFIYPYDEKNVFFGKENGFFHFDPSLPLELDSNFQVLIRNVHLVNGQSDSLIFGGYHSVATKTPKFRHFENALHFQYAATHFSDVEKNQYQYFLDGFDEGWSNWSTKTAKDYTNLAPGTYTFKVRAKNVYNVESVIAAYKFKINPPWYASKIAYFFYMLFVGTGLFGLIFIPKKQFEKEKAELQIEQEKTLQEKEKTIEQGEQKIGKLKNEKLEAAVAHKTKELATATMLLVQKSEMLQTLKKDIDKISKNSKEPETSIALKKVVKKIGQNIELAEDWEQFAQYFDQVHSNFLKRLQTTYPQLSPKDHRLSAYLRMNLSTKEIAPLMNISVRGVEVSRYRLRKKLELGSDVNLTEFMMRL